MKNRLGGRSFRQFEGPFMERLKSNLLDNTIDQIGADVTTLIWHPIRIICRTVDLRSHLVHHLRDRSDTSEVLGIEFSQEQTHG